MALTDKLRKAREKLERATMQKKAEKQAKARRIEKGEPEGFGEKAAVAGKEAKKLGGQAKEFASEATPVSKDQAEEAGGILGGIGEGAGSVIDDVESGDLDEFGMDSNMDDGLDMDLDDIP